MAEKSSPVSLKLCLKRYRIWIGVHAFYCRCEDLPTRLLIRRANSNMVCSSGFPWEEIPLKKLLLSLYTQKCPSWMWGTHQIHRTADVTVHQQHQAIDQITGDRERVRQEALQARLVSALIWGFNCIMDAACIWLMHNHKNTIAFWFNLSLQMSLINKNTQNIFLLVIKEILEHTSACSPLQAWGLKSGVGGVTAPCRAANARTHAHTHTVAEKVL